MALVGSTPIGSPVIGALSDVAGPRYALGLGAAACLAAVIVGGWSRDGRRGHTQQPEGNSSSPAA
jgi:MFS family permease